MGQQSYLHAVRVQIPIQNEVPVPLSSDLNLPSLSNSPANLSADKQSSSDVKPISESFLSEESLVVKDTKEEETETLEAKHSKSNFFVYCNSCSKMSEGKLRVRCAKCLSGAFMVSRHPENWNDVLIPNQVRKDQLKFPTQMKSRGSINYSCNSGSRFLR